MVASAVFMGKFLRIVAKFPERMRLKRLVKKEVGAYNYGTDRKWMLKDSFTGLQRLSWLLHIENPEREG